MFNPMATTTMNPKPVYLMYLASWRNTVPEPSLVSEITHVSLAFVSPSFFDTPEPPSPTSLEPFFTDVNGIRAKFSKGTKVLWALGGWGDTESFRVARTEESRRLFAKNVKAVLDATSVDGIDLDWEYPGGNGENYKQPGSTNADKIWEIDAYPKLVSELRAVLGPDRTICAALPCIPRDMIAFDAEHLAKIVPHMDFFNLMAYDLINRRDTVTKHHAGIEDSLVAVEKYLGNGMPPEKAVLGFAFYLKWFKILPVKDHSEPVKSPVGLPTIQMEDPVTGEDLGGTSAVLWSDGPDPSLAASFERSVKGGSYDDRHKGHYYLDNEENLFWTWETPDAIVKKYNMVLQRKGLGGAFAWDLGGDSKDWSHLKALNSAIKGELLPVEGDERSYDEL